MMTIYTEKNTKPMTLTDKIIIERFFAAHAEYMSTLYQMLSNKKDRQIVSLFYLQSLYWRNRNTVYSLVGELHISQKEKDGTVPVFFLL